MAEEKKLSEEQLDAVAGGIANVDVSGSNVKGNQTIYDEHKQDVFIGGNVTVGDGNTSAGGDVTGGNKTDVDVKNDVKTDVKASLF